MGRYGQQNLLRDQWRVCMRKQRQQSEWIMSGRWSLPLNLECSMDSFTNFVVVFIELLREGVLGVVQFANN